MFRIRDSNRKQNAGSTGLAAGAGVFLLSVLASGPGLADAPFEFKHPVANQAYSTLPIPLRIIRKPGTAVPVTEAIDVHFEIRQWPHPYGFVGAMRNAILPGKTDYETSVVYFWTPAPGTYSIRARADGFEDDPVEISFTTTFTLDRPLYRVIKPESTVYQGGKVALVVDWDPFWATVPDQPYGTLYAEVESWDEDTKAWAPEWKSGNLAGFQLPIVLPQQFSIDIQAPVKPTAKRVRVRPSFSRKAYTLPTGWRYFCQTPQGKVTGGPEQSGASPEPGPERKPCIGVSVESGPPAGLKN
ncbi:hypothetical protein [Anderseniella sp. Alg231-50]|uniref:hypothetical protein n=1 Tax=Anderseniella sp. Alg231-50 TaxID=1922226 RepID=UPI000D55F894